MYTSFKFNIRNLNISAIHHIELIYKSPCRITIRDIQIHSLHDKARQTYKKTQTEASIRLGKIHNYIIKDLTTLHSTFCSGELFGHAGIFHVTNDFTC